MARRKLNRPPAHAQEDYYEPKTPPPSSSPNAAIVCTRSRLNFTRRLAPLFLGILLPALYTRELWAEMWGGMKPHAWDGSGHLALTQIYDQSIFPDTFGWTHAFFGGIPFPNFYPPLFYWLVSLLHHTHLVSLSAAFKIVLTLPVLLLPAATWAVTRKVSGKNNLVAACAALATLPLLVDFRFYGGAGLLMGLSYTSTFLLGLYTQPLGYVLLLAWYVVYCDTTPSLWRLVLSSVLLALALLANFFASNVAALFIATTLIDEALKLRRMSAEADRLQVRRSLLAHFFSPLLSGCLVMFWVASVFTARDYFPSSPTGIEFRSLFSFAMLGWYIVASVGVIVWLRRPTLTMRPYLTTCLLLALAVLCAGTVAPAWLPLHAERLLTMLNFLLAVPVGHVLAFILEKAFLQFGLDLSEHRQYESRRGTPRRKPVTTPRPLHILYAAFALLVGSLVILGSITPPSFKLSFYPAEGSGVVDPLLQYAREHKGGRYLVETPPFSDNETAHDGRAISSYLGAQGNESLSLFFREAGPNVIFFNSLVRSLSVYGDATNISSVLIDDQDFAAQPVSDHLEQASFIGVRHLVMRSPWAKDRLARESAIKGRHDFGQWSVYELGGEPFRHVQPLSYKPALVLSGLSFKQRRRNEYEFVRFAEEQFAAGWFDVLLARSPETKIDRLHVPDGFGALVVDTYDCDNEDRALEVLRQFARQRPLIILASEAPLFRRIRNAIADFPNAEIIERPAELPGPWLKPGPPTASYETNSVRKVWREIRRVLDKTKVPVGSGAAGDLKAEVGQSDINIHIGGEQAEAIPVLVKTTYHPNWQRSDGEVVYPATTFFMLTFVRESARMTFARRPLDRVGLWVSALTLLLICGYTFWHYRPQLLKTFRRFAFSRRDLPGHARRTK